MLARSGEITAPCPVPLSLTATIPSSRMPAFSHFWIRRMTRLSPIRCSTKRMSQSLLTSSKKDRMSASSMKFTFLLSIPTHSASSASCVPHPCPCPFLCSARAVLARIPLGPCPWLHRLRGGSLRVVHRLHSYYGGV